MIVLDYVIALALLVVAGLPIGYVITRRVVFAAVIAPLVTALTGAVAIILMLIVGGQMLFWLAGLLVVECAAVPVLLKRYPGAALPHGSWRDVLCYTLPLVPPSLMVFGPPIAWDANLIWWLHAAYFTKSADVARDYVGNPLIVWSHTDYPPLASAPVAMVWQVLGTYDLRVAQAVSSVVTLAAIAALAYAVRRVTAAAVPAWASRLAGAAVALVVWVNQILLPGITSGMSDPLWASAFVAAATLLLLGKDPLARPALPVLLLTVAVLTKNEGFIAVILLSGLVLLRERRNLRRAWIIVVPLAAGGVWALVTRHLGAQSDLLAGGHFGELLRGEPAIRGRFDPTVAAIRRMVDPYVKLALAAGLLGGVFLRRRRRDLEIGSDLWLWLIGGAFLVVLITTYLISPHELRWHLLTSIDRVTLPIVLLAGVSVICWAAIAASRRPAPVPQSDPDAGDLEDSASGHQSVPVGTLTGGQQ